MGLRASTLRALGYRVEGLFGGLEFMQGWVGEREREIEVQIDRLMELGRWVDELVGQRYS